MSAGLLAFALLVGVLVVVPAVTGATPMTILTSSMVPTYLPGTLIIVTKPNSDSIRIGDPITYQLESGKVPVVTHRVIAITSTSDGERTFPTRVTRTVLPTRSPFSPCRSVGRSGTASPTSAGSTRS